MTTGTDQKLDVPTRPRRLRRLEPQALLGVLVRELINYSSFWRSSAFSSIMEPTLYLLAFGYGVGALVDRNIGDLTYIQYVGTGTVAAAALFSSAFPAMYSTFVKYKFQRTYDGIMAAPVDAEEIVTAEGLWIATRAGVYGMAPILVLLALNGIDLTWGMLLIPLISFLSGIGWAFFGITVSAVLDSIDNFSYVVSGLLMPTMFVSGTFFPITQLPGWGETLAQVNPLYHCVELVRHAIFGIDLLTDLGHLVFLAIFAAVMWRIAANRLKYRLVD